MYTPWPCAEVPFFRQHQRVLAITRVAKAQYTRCIHLHFHVDPRSLVIVALMVVVHTIGFECARVPQLFNAANYKFEDTGRPAVLMGNR